MLDAPDRNTNIRVPTSIIINRYQGKSIRKCNGFFHASNVRGVVLQYYTSASLKPFPWISYRWKFALQDLLQRHRDLDRQSVDNWWLDLGNADLSSQSSLSAETTKDFEIAVKLRWNGGRFLGWGHYYDITLTLNKEAKEEPAHQKFLFGYSFRRRAYSTQK